MEELHICHCAILNKKASWPNLKLLHINDENDLEAEEVESIDSFDDVKFRLGTKENLVAGAVEKGVLPALRVLCSKYLTSSGMSGSSDFLRLFKKNIFVHQPVLQYDPFMSGMCLCHSYSSQSAETVRPTVEFWNTRL